MRKQEHQRNRYMTFPIEMQEPWMHLLGQIIVAPTGHQVLVQSVAPINGRLVIRGEIMTSGGAKK